MKATRQRACLPLISVFTPQQQKPTAGARARSLVRGPTRPANVEPSFIASFPTFSPELDFILSALPCTKSVYEASLLWRLSCVEVTIVQATLRARGIHAVGPFPITREETTSVHKGLSSCLRAVKHQYAEGARVNGKAAIRMQACSRCLHSCRSSRSTHPRGPT